MSTCNVPTTMPLSDIRFPKDELFGRTSIHGAQMYHESRTALQQNYHECILVTTACRIAGSWFAVCAV